MVCRIRHHDVHITLPNYVMHTIPASRFRFISPGEDEGSHESFASGQSINEPSRRKPGRGASCVGRSWSRLWRVVCWIRGSGGEGVLGFWRVVMACLLLWWGFVGGGYFGIGMGMGRAWRGREGSEGGWRRWWGLRGGGRPDRDCGGC